MNSILISVAAYPDNPAWTNIIQDNRKEYCKLKGGTLVLDTVPPQFSHKGPSKIRVPLILMAFENGYDRVLWVDSDALLLNTITEEDLPDRLAFAHDAGGINDGIIVTVRKDEKMWRMVDELMIGRIYKDDPMSAQTIVQIMNPVHDHLSLDLWNARWWNGYAKIIHFAGEQDRFEKVRAAYYRRKSL